MQQPISSPRGAYVMVAPAWFVRVYPSKASDWPLSCLFFASPLYSSWYIFLFCPYFLALDPFSTFNSVQSRLHLHLLVRASSIQSHATITYRHHDYRDSTPRPQRRGTTDFKLHWDMPVSLPTAEPLSRNWRMYASTPVQLVLPRN